MTAKCRNSRYTDKTLLNDRGQRCVEEDNIPLTVRKRIKPNFHIVFEGDTIRVWWRKTDHRTDRNGDLYIRNEEGVGKSITLGLWKEVVAHFPPGPSHAEAAIDHVATVGSNGMETSDPNAIGTVEFEPHCLNDREEVDCEVVKVVEKSKASVKKPCKGALLIIETDVIVEKVGRACVSSKLLISLPWKQRLVVLG